ncbi:tigger transposable element-derived protein 1 [Trichonephila clavipes]|uniref:Tigger transposable element-derived protein 1 n=1 Tax=Trichonephila clavipes TaxID=2585209 RepID=A0A8X6W594_TRICX|nr:tigger transposable element-derived protein 1 [Trichonephila clavipes]
MVNNVPSHSSCTKLVLTAYAAEKKHQRQSISLETKIAILDRLGKGEGSTAIGKHLNLGESTVRAIKKNEAAIRKSVISGTKLSTKFASYTRDVLLERTERAIAIWIEEQVQRRIPVSGYLIQEKALQFYKSEPSTSTSQTGKEFSASKGWVTGFLKINALHNIKITGKSATADEGAAKIFPEKLAKIIEDGDYSADQVFNADETGHYWKRLPNRTYIAKDETTESGHKESKYRVTLLLCSNASGDRMLKPLLINKSLRPRALKASAQIRPRTLNACWEKIWPACVTDNTTTQTSTLSDEIINLAHEIGGDGFNTFSHDDIEELLVDDALSDNDIIDLTLEGDNDEEEKSTPLTGKLIQEGLQLCSKLENHFLINDPNSERASKLQRELQNCMSGYRELYKKIKESSSQSLITDYIVRKGRATQNENEVCENPWPLPQISIVETVSSDDEGDLEPLLKRCKPLSESNND